jgi:ribonuclease-3 family protein
MSEQNVSFPAAALPSSEALAYLGDAVFSLFVREELVRTGISHAKDLNRLSLSFVTAESQAALFHKIEERLTEWEKDIYHRAYNHKGLKPPKHASHAEYRTATGLEAVVGALYYTGQADRISELLGELKLSAED